PPLALLAALAPLATACAGGKLASPAPPSTVASTGYAPGYAPPSGHTPSAPAPPPSHAAISSPSLPAGGDVAIDRPAPPDERPGLATSWGESVWSPITTSPFVRAAAQPWAGVVLHYNSADGVRAHAAHVGGAIAPLEAPIGDGSLGVALVGDDGALLPGVVAGGRNLVVGRDGDRYRIVVRNATAARFEIVASVDGLDVIDGQPAGLDRRGYLVEPYGTLVIDGFRRSAQEVAAFRFGSVAASYAARTSGDANVGVVGLAVFAERGAIWDRAELERRDQADPFPARAYAPPP
ncbi:MAG TPA: hypothetical protein VM734_27810, partial [Kofleriaceae bacterium]|nr:hypothetical protein [Kofleriaceae bacterium]